MAHQFWAVVDAATGVVSRAVVKTQPPTEEIAGSVWVEMAAPTNDGGVKGAVPHYAGPGWVYCTNGVEHPERFAIPWTQPESVEDAYPAGSLVAHHRLVYCSQVDGNMTEPGTGPDWCNPTSGTQHTQVGS